jgi:glycolate oxidase iron-sulfur subunit
MQQFRQEDLLKCIHCGLCLQSCPTYVETGSEAASPRGRIYLMRAVSEGRIQWEPATARHIDQCLGCRACEPACPSGVAYGFLLETARAQIERSRVRKRSHRLAKQWLLRLMTNPRTFALMLNVARWFAPLWGDWALPAPLARLLGLNRVVARLPVVEGKARMGKLDRLYPPISARRGRVALLTGCVASVLFHRVNVASVAVLRHNGFEVVVPPDQGCCGALHVHNGFVEDGQQRALRLMQAFERESVDAVIVNSAGCGSTMKEYGKLFACTSHAARAAKFAAQVKDIMEFLVEVGIQAPPQSLSGRGDSRSLLVTYHDACHLAHAQGIRKQPREIVRTIPGVQLVEMEEADMCCGSAGIYNLLQPDLALRLLQRKVERICATGAEIVLTANPGCLAWIAQGLREGSHPIEILHPVELLHRAYARSA